MTASKIKKNIAYRLRRYFNFTRLNPKMSTRIFAISDLHIDYQENRKLVNGWSAAKYRDDVIIVAGDVTDNLGLLETTLKGLQTKFRQVFFVPGNHELWMRSGDEPADSIAKFHAILSMCGRLGVATSPGRVPVTATDHVWIVPLFSWYATPEDDPENSFYVRPSAGEDAGKQRDIWMDNHLCEWPTTNSDGRSRADYFADLNRGSVERSYDAPVISFSHFVPRRELIGASESDRAAVDCERARRGLAPFAGTHQGAAGFNFTRYAGSHQLEQQVSWLQPAVHVYGHQHRNRDRVIDGVRYVAHCLGSPSDQREGWTWGQSEWGGPKQVWPSQKR